MWPFSKKREPEILKPEGSWRSDPRYGSNPMALFFECYVLKVLGYLEPKREQTLIAMNLGKALNTKATDWESVVREALHLSETIDIAILDLWYTNSSASEAAGQLYEPAAYAQDFTDQFLAPDSKVDVWSQGALEAAKARIASYKQRRIEA